MSILLNGNMGFSTMSVAGLQPAFQSGDVVGQSGFLNVTTTIQHAANIQTEGDFIYAASGVGIYKLNKNTLEVLNSYILPSTTLTGAVIVGDYVYAAPSNSNSGVYKLNKSNLSLHSITTEKYPGTTYGMVTDGSFLYLGGTNPRTVWKYDLSTMTRVGISAVYDESQSGTNIATHFEFILYYNGKIYIRGRFFYLEWWELDASTLTVLRKATTNTGNAYSYENESFVDSNGIIWGGTYGKTRFDTVTMTALPANSTNGVSTQYTRCLINYGTDQLLQIPFGPINNTTEFNISKQTRTFEIINKSNFSLVTRGIPNLPYTLQYGTLDLIEAWRNVRACTDSEHLYILFQHYITKVKL